MTKKDRTIFYQLLHLLRNILLVTTTLGISLSSIAQNAHSSKIETTEDPPFDFVKVQCAVGAFIFNDFYSRLAPLSGEITTLLRLQKEKAHYLGVGTGINYFPDLETVFIPLFLSLQSELYPQKSFTPFAYADIGYGFNQKEDFQDLQHKIEQLNGLRYGLGIGLKNKRSPSSMWSASLGYHYQRHVSQETWFTSVKSNLNLAHLHRMRIQLIAEF